MSVFLGFSQLRLHRKAEFLVSTLDTDSLPLCHGGLALESQLRYKDSSGKILPVEINDRRDGKYVVSFTPDAQGTVTLGIKINDKHINRSPFTFEVRAVRPHTGVFHCCTFCSSKGTRGPTCACEGTMENFTGCGHGHPGHPGRRHWSCCGNVLENSECSVANRLLHPEGSEDE